MLIRRHSLVRFIFSHRYARLAADVAQQGASSCPHKGKLFFWGRPLGLNPNRLERSAKQALRHPRARVRPALVCSTGWKRLCDVHPEMATGVWHSVGEPRMTALEKCYKNKKSVSLSFSIWLSDLSLVFSLTTLPTFPFPLKNQYSKLLFEA